MYKILYLIFQTSCPTVLTNQKATKDLKSQQTALQAKVQTLESLLKDQIQRQVMNLQAAVKSLQKDVIAVKKQSNIQKFN